MEQASAALMREPAGFELASGEQASALESLGEALALLAPPPERQEQDQEQGGDQQQQSQGGQDDEQAESEAGADPAQLLQAVRDREAQRRRKREGRGSGSHDPVEKDW